MDTTSLPPAEAAHVETLVSDATSVTGSGRSSGADRFQYTISITEAGRTRTVRLSEGNIPEPAQALVEYLVDAARKEGHRKA